MSLARTVLPLAAAFAIVLSSGRGRADEAAARVHFRKGVDLYDKKQYEAALAAFKAAYAEKPSAGIKQNIALSLKALSRVVEAATAFDEALDEGTSTLDPRTRAAIEAELAELTKQVATIRLSVVDASKRPVDGATITVDGVALAPGAARRPIRLAQGIHTFTAHVDGLADPPPKKLALVLGQPVDATFVMGGSAQAQGTLSVRANVDDAVIRIDGVELGRGSWSGNVPAGAHRVEVSAPGHRTASFDVPVSGGATLDYPVALAKEGELPGAYEHVDRPPPPRPKRLYIVPTLAGQGASYRLSAALDEPPAGTRRGFGGLALGVRGGVRFGRWAALELHAEAGALSSSYRVQPNDVLDSETSVNHWQLTPMFRFTTPGKVRFALGTGLGVRGLSVDAAIVRGPARVEEKGSGAGLSWLADAGMQFDTGPVFLEGMIFFDVHGVAAARDPETNARFLQASPATRIGLRFGLGIPF